MTDDCETIIPIQRPESPSSFGSYIDKMFHHLHRVIRERDESAEVVDLPCFSVVFTKCYCMGHFAIGGGVSTAEQTLDCDV
jgi:hypothetical protein